MGSLNAFFVRKVADDVMSVVGSMFSLAEIKTNAEYIHVLLEFYTEVPEHDLIELSSRLETDVMWLSYQSVVDGFEYYHWYRGVLLRALAYGTTTERTWERIEGQPEAWEHSAFFDPGFLAFILEDEESEDEKQRLEQFWQIGELIIGRMEPYVGAQNSAHYVATYYRFPGWNL